MCFRTTPEAIGRKLKELQLVSDPGTLALLAWEDLDARLELVTANDKKESLGGEITDAGETGLFAWVSSPGAWDATTKAVRWKNDPRGRTIAYRVVLLEWDGTRFHAKITPGDIKADGRQVPLL